MLVTDLTLVDAADAIARREISSVDVTERCLQRCADIGTKLNCVTVLERHSALVAAERADADLRRGRVHGPLHGVPLAHKDLFYRAGRIVACGSKIRSDFVPDVTATVLHRLDQAGALYLGGLHMSEFALSPVGHNAHYGYCKNPWNLDYVTGGSSSGSAAAVAARLVYGSLGSDTGGSIRIPASMCGVVGLKPTYTLVTRAGAMPLSFSLDCVGPIARTARDCARMLSVICGGDDADSLASTRPKMDYEAHLSGDIRDLRIGVPGTYYYDCVTDGVRRCLDDSLAVLRSLGVRIVQVDVPDVRPLNALNNLLLSVEAAAVHRQWLISRPEDYSRHVRSRLEVGLQILATRYFEALALRGPLTTEFLRTAFAQVDALHLPSVPIPVPPIAETSGGDSAKITGLFDTIVHCTRAINFLGLPAVSVPAGFSDNGLPIGFQLIGRHFDEALLLRIADAFQRSTDWHVKSPNLAAHTS